jgi:putative membrane protein
MISFLIRLVVNAVALIAVAYIVPGVHVTGFTAALIAGFVLGIANAILRPIFFILSLPLQILTLGLFTFVVNAAIFWLVAHLGIGLTVDGFWSGAFLGAIVLSIVSFLLSWLLKPATDAVEKS